jgi:hypothetical protein
VNVPVLDFDACCVGVLDHQHTCTAVFDWYLYKWTRLTDMVPVMLAERLNLGVQPEGVRNFPSVGSRLWLPAGAN